jgi:2'-5' RNA ligase
MEAQTFRTFLAAPISKKIEKKLADLIRQFKSTQPGNCVKWVSAQNIHITFKFLGNTPLHQAFQIADVLDQYLAQQKPVELTLREVGAFPNLSKPNVLWIGISEIKSLERIYSITEEICSEYGFPRETKPFKPHLTIGRLSRNVSGIDSKKIGDLIIPAKNTCFGQMLLKEVVVFHSELRPSGPVYTPIRKIRIGTEG